MNSPNRQPASADSERDLDRVIAWMIAQPAPHAAQRKTLEEAAGWVSRNQESSQPLPKRPASKQRTTWISTPIIAGVVVMAVFLAGLIGWAMWTARPPSESPHETANEPRRETDVAEVDRHLDKQEVDKQTVDKQEVEKQEADKQKIVRQPPAALAGVYPPTYQGAVAQRATVLVATGRKQSLHLGAFTPYNESGNTLHVWDWSKSPRSRVFADQRLWPKDVFALSPNGQKIVWAKGRILDLVSGEDSTIDLGGEYYPSSGPKYQGPLVRRINHLQFAPDGERLAIHIYEFDAEPSQHALRKRDLTSRGVVQLLSFPDGRKLAEFPAGRLLLAYPSADRVIAAVPPEQYGQRLVEYDANSGRVVREFKPQLEGFAYAIEASANGKYLAAIDDKVGLLIWEWPSGQLLHTVKELRRASPSTVVCFSPDGEFVAVHGIGNLFVVDVAQGSVAAQLKSNSAARVAWSADGKRITVVSGHSLYEGGPLGLYNSHMAVDVWDWASGKRVQSLDSEPPR